MKNYLPSFFFFLLLMMNQLQQLDAQNLVPNGSFELYSHCPNSTSQVDSCIGWHHVLNTPDYFATCSPYPVSIPNNFAGDQLSFDNDAYMGLLTYVWWQPWREIIGTQLIDTLIPGNTYHISMRVSRSNWTNDAYNTSASNKIGLRFTTNIYTLNNSPVINNFAQIYEDSIIADTINWVLLYWNYTADSAYTHVYIGNFFDDAHTDTLVINAPLGQFGQAYYFIDSVNIFCTSANCFTEVSELQNDFIQISPNPFTTQLQIQYTITQPGDLMVYDALGRKVKSCSLPSNQKAFQLSLAELPAGVYLVAINSDGKSFTEKVVKQ